MNNKPPPHTHWRHYKSTGGVDHTYEVIGIARHSETQEDMVVYRPLYDILPPRLPSQIQMESTPQEGNGYLGYDFFVRPLAMWHDIVEYEGQQIQRFTQID